MPAKSIIIVEDEGIVAADLEDRLQRWGHMVVAKVASGQRALDEVARLKPDLVLMDIIIEGVMDGVQTAEQIMAQHEIPVIFLTAHADNPTMKRAQLTGPFGYVLKPFDERELHVAVEIAAYRAQVEKKLRQVNMDLKKALDEIKTLSGLLPICAWCKKIRDDSGYWHQVEMYLKRHTTVDFTHGICPECLAKAKSSLQAEREAKAKLNAKLANGEL